MSIVGQQIVVVTFLKDRRTLWKIYHQRQKEAENNIHSWDDRIKGGGFRYQRELLNSILMREEKRNGYWVWYWLDGWMPLSIDQIRAFIQQIILEELLEDLVIKGYLKKNILRKKVDGKRVQDRNLPLGYNIVAGKMLFEINKILDPKDVAPTLCSNGYARTFLLQMGKVLGI